MFLGFMCTIFLYLFVIGKVIFQENDCLTSAGSIGVCVRIEECPSIYTVFKNAPRPLPSNVTYFLNLSLCGFSRDTTNIDIPKVCCADEISTTESIQKITTTQQPVPIFSHENLNLLPRNNCGDILEQLTRANTSELFEYPWMVLLRYEHDGEVQSLCGGSLINERYVLTAAHCVTRLKSTITLIGVRLGEYDTSTEIDCCFIGKEKVCADPVQDISIEEVIHHPDFDKPRYSNDIAIIRLSRPADMTSESVRPICHLPTTFYALNLTLRRVLITGWGTTETQRQATVLLEARLPIVPNDVCQTKFFKRSVQLMPSQLSAGGENGVDSCKGDSGGPVMYPAQIDGVRMVQFGINSAGVSVCSNTNNFPGIYVRVSYYMEWILDHIRP